MATWGSQTWGFSNWGTLGDTTAEVSGRSLTSQLGSTLAVPSVGWGALFWGANEWGEFASPEAIVTGNSLTLSLTSVSAGTNFTFEATGIELQTQQGEEVSGISITAEPTGEELQSTNAGAFGGELVTVEVTSAANEAWGENPWSVGGWGVGDGNTISIGTSIGRAGAGANPSGSQINTTVADVVAGISITAEPTGEELQSTNAGAFGGELVIVEVSSPAHDEWGTEYWGSGQWGVGDGVTVIVGTETEHIADANVTVTGVQSAFQAVGTVEIPVVIDSGIQISLTTDGVFGGELVTVPVSTASTQPWGETAWGDGQWGQSVGTDISQGGEEVAVPSVEVDVTGEELQTNTGDETVTGTANVTLTGLTLLDIQLGDEDAFTDVRVNVTGQELGPIVIGDFLAGISAEAKPTSVTATVSSGIMSVNAWAVVDAGDEPTWTVVDIAA